MQGCLIKERGASEFIGMPACSGVKVRPVHLQPGVRLAPAPTMPCAALDCSLSAGLPPPRLPISN